MVVEWVRVADEMPPSGHAVLAYYVNSYGKGRRVRALHFATKAEMDDYFSDYEGSDDDPEPGWFETNDNEETSYRITDEVTHWMAMPYPPRKDD